jgi:hypothetical protein
MALVLWADPAREPPGDAPRVGEAALCSAEHVRNRVAPARSMLDPARRAGAAGLGTCSTPLERVRASSEHAQPCSEHRQVDVRSMPAPVPSMPEPVRSVSETVKSAVVETKRGLVETKRVFGNAKKENEDASAPGPDAYWVIPAPKVLLLRSSMRMNAPVARLSGSGSAKTDAAPARACPERVTLPPAFPPLRGCGRARRV